MTKIKAKCQEKSCRRRLWTKEGIGPHCLNGHGKVSGLVTRTPKGTISTKGRATKEAAGK